MTKFAAQLLLKQPSFPHLLIDMGENESGAPVFVAGYDTVDRGIEDTLFLYDGGLSEELMATHCGLVHVNELPSAVARKANAITISKIQRFSEKENHPVQARINIPGRGGP